MISSYVRHQQNEEILFLHSRGLLLSGDKSNQQAITPEGLSHASGTQKSKLEPSKFLKKGNINKAQKSDIYSDDGKMNKS